MFKKIIPYVLAIIVFFAAMLLLRPAPLKRSSWPAMTCAPGNPGRWRSDHSGHARQQCCSDALTDSKQGVGQTLKLDRGQGISCVLPTWAS